MVTPANRSADSLLLTLQRGLWLLEAVAEAGGEITVKALCHQLGLKLTTCYHFIRTLEAAGYLTRLKGGRLALGSRIAYLQSRLRALYAPDPTFVEIASRIHSATGETTYIVGWHGDDIVLQYFIEGSQSLHVRSLEIGYRGNAHARASGKAVLAFLPEPWVRAYFAARGLPKLTINTITDLEILIEHLREVAARGFAVDREEFAEGVCCISAPFFDERGFPVGAFTVSLPASRFKGRAKGLVELVVDGAVEASRYRGYAGRYPPPSPLFQVRRSRSGGEGQDSRPANVVGYGKVGNYRRRGKV
jgi:IclR family acetate operon transcriptional repressor